MDDGYEPSAVVVGAVEPGGRLHGAAEENGEIGIRVGNAGGAHLEVVDFRWWVRSAGGPARGDEEAGGVVGVDGVSGAAGIGDALADVVGDVGVDGGLGIAVVGETPPSSVSSLGDMCFFRAAASNV